MARRFAWLELAVDGGSAELGRIVFELFSDRAPRTVENFAALCSGRSGVSRLSGAPLHFLGSVIHRIVPGFVVQGGDITRGNGTGGESVYGPKFADETFAVRHDARGVLSMANSGPNSNNSQFFVTLGAVPHLNGSHVAFGRVIEGLAVLSALEHLPRNGEKPLDRIVVTGCGELDGPPASSVAGGAHALGVLPAGSAPPSSASEGRGSLVELVNAGLPKAFGGRRRRGRHDKGDGAGVVALEAAVESLAREKGGRVEAAASASVDSVVKASVAPAVASHVVAGGEVGTGGDVDAGGVLSQMSPHEQQLFELRLRMNEGRKANQDAVTREYRGHDTDSSRRRRGREEHKEKRDDVSGGSVSGVVEIDPALNVTAAASGSPERHKGTTGTTGTAALRRACEKRLRVLDSSEPGVERMAGELAARASHSKKRRRVARAGETVDYVNERNRLINRALDKAFNEYTVETRLNLERGTAL